MEKEIDVKSNFFTDTDRNKLNNIEKFQLGTTKNILIKNPSLIDRNQKIGDYKKIKCLNCEEIIYLELEDKKILLNTKILEINLPSNIKESENYSEAFGILIPKKSFFSFFK